MTWSVSVLGVVSSMAVLVLGACAPAGDAEDGDRRPKPFPVLEGSYLGQEPPPRDRGVLFAPGVVSTGLYNRDVAMTPDGRAIYYGVVLGNYDHSAIMVTAEENGRWTEPVVAPFSGRYRDLEPALSPDGERFFFISHRPHREGDTPREDADIWVMDREAGGAWGEPRPLGPPVNTDGPEYFPSLTRDGTLYFTRDGEDGGSALFRARPTEDGYAEPERLGPAVNSVAAQYNGFIDPDERFLIFSAYGREDSLGGSDYYVSFRDDDDTWTGPVPMGERVNSASGLEYSASVTPDGRYLLFMAARSRFPGDSAALPRTQRQLLTLHAEPRNGLPDIYWIDAGFIEALRPPT